MSAIEEYREIISSHGFVGEIAGILAEIFANYSERYLADILGGYYNSSINKAPTLDALLQIALDTAYPVWRGSNTIISFLIDSTHSFLSLQPLQEVFSYESNYFYYGGREHLYITPESFVGSKFVEIKLIYSSTPKKVIEFNLDKNEIYVIDDRRPISEHLAFFTIYELEGFYNIEVIPHTRNPKNFWAFHPDAISEELFINHNIHSLFYHIMVLTTPEYGIYAKFSDKITLYSGIKKIRLEYLNYDISSVKADVFPLLYEHLIENMGLKIYNISGGIMDKFRIDSGIPAESPEEIRKNLTRGNRFRGILRGTSDIKNMINEDINSLVFDMKTFHFIDEKSAQNTNMAPPIFYLIVAITKPEYSINQLYNYLNYVYNNIWTSNFPSLQTYVVDGNTTIGDLYSGNYNASIVSTSSNDTIFVIEPIKAKLIINYAYSGGNKANTKSMLMEYIANNYQYKIINGIDPMDIFKFFVRNQNVNKTLFFMVSLEINCDGDTKRRTYFRFYSGMSQQYPQAYDDIIECFPDDSYTSTDISQVSRYIKLVRFDELYQRLSEEFINTSPGGQINFENYFVSIYDYEVLEIM